MLIFVVVLELLFCTEISCCWPGTRRFWFLFEFDDWFGWFIIHCCWWIFCRFIDQSSCFLLFCCSIFITDHCLFWDELVQLHSQQKTYIPQPTTHSPQSKAHSPQLKHKIILTQSSQWIYRWHEVGNSHKSSPPKKLLSAFSEEFSMLNLWMKFRPQLICMLNVLFLILERWSWNDSWNHEWPMRIYKVYTRQHPLRANSNEHRSGSWTPKSVQMNTIRSSERTRLLNFVNVLPSWVF